jgi:hypothetical protein
MKEYKNYEELKEAPEEVFNHMALMEDHPDSPPPNVNFEEWWGGNIYLLESEEELDNISTTITTDDDSRWKTIRETADSFDDCRLLRSGNYVVIFTATTDAGGPTYFIPKVIVDKCPHVMESVKLSKEAWGG